MASMTRLEDKPNGKCRKWRLFASRGSGKSRVQRSRRFEGTYTEARAALAEFEREFRALPALGESSMTVREYAGGWMERRRGKVAETSRDKDRAQINAACWVIGDVPMRDVTPAVLSDMYGRMMRGESITGRELSPAYVNAVGVKLGMVFADAVERGVLAESPVRAADMPKVRYREKVPPSAARVSALLGLLDVADPRQMCAYLCASMGLRKGEALGLSWGDVDGDVMHVCRTYRYNGELAPCKTGSGMRDLPVPPHVREALSRRRGALERDLGRLAEAGVKPPPGAAAWPLMGICARADGERTTVNSATEWWMRRRASLGMEGVSLHMLRHAYLTAAAVQGVPPKVMQALAGHSSPVMTMRIYAHANMDAKKAASEIVASVLHPQQG